MTGAPANTSEDSRWQAFNTTGLTCSCGQRHVGLFPINMLTPLGWKGSSEYQEDSALTMDRTFISPRYAVWDGQSFAIRMRLPLMMRGASPAAFMYTVWASIDRIHFENYVKARNEGKLSNLRQFSARLLNRLGGHHDTSNLVGISHEENDGELPLLLLGGPQPYTNRPDHPILTEQRQGIGFDRMLELFQAYNHDMRAAASAANAS
jgi:hypothetical protein